MFTFQKSSTRFFRVAFIILLCFSAVLSEQALSQSFTKMTNSEVTSDGGSSFFCGMNDYNNDGWLDIFITNFVDENNFLYLNNGNGTFTKNRTSTIIRDGGNSISSSWGDYDNDGDLDLFVANRNQSNFLYRNEGEAGFTKITSGLIVTEVTNSMGASWGDYDNDGFLDLFVANYGQNNVLYHNNGDGTFRKIIEGNIVSNGGRSTSGAWADCDSDGFLDLYVTNWGQNNFFYHNNGDGTFTRILDRELTNDNSSSIGCSWADYDNDGDLDLFVVNGFENNFLCRNEGNGTFTRINSGPIIDDSGFSCSSSWGDYDNDGDLDLFIANWNEPSGKKNSLFENIGQGNFSKVTNSQVVLDEAHSVGSSWGDIDNDGDLDLLVANDGGHDNYLYINDGNTNNWINIKCVGITSNASAIGCVVRAKATIQSVPIWQTRDISGQTGFSSQHSLNVEFGLADATQIDSLIIQWPSGVKQIKTNVDVNQFIEVKEPTTLLSAANITAYPNEIVEVPFIAKFPEDYEFHSAEFKISGFYEQLILEDIMIDSCIINTSGWLCQYNMRDSVLSIWMAGSEPISGEGELFRLRLAVSDFDHNFIPINIKDALFDTGEIPVKKTSGGVNILNGFAESRESKNESRMIGPADTYSLEQNYPNPFNPATTIHYSIKETGLVQLYIYNEIGHLVKTLVDGFQANGRYAIMWNGTDNLGQSVASGTYFYLLKTNHNEIQSKRMTLVK